MVLQALGLLRIAVIVAVWLPMAMTYRRFGAAPAITVVLVFGAAGWWVTFRRLEQWQERCVALCYGPKDHALGWAAHLAWSQLSPSVRTWTRIVYAFAVIAPIVQILCHRP